MAGGDSEVACDRFNGQSHNQLVEAEDGLLQIDSSGVRQDTLRQAS
jgi:hypothetical protein